MTNTHNITALSSFEDHMKALQKPCAVFSKARNICTKCNGTGKKRVNPIGKPVYMEPCRHCFGSGRVDL